MKTIIITMLLVFSFKSMAFYKDIELHQVPIIEATKQYVIVSPQEDAPLASEHQEKTDHHTTTQIIAVNQDDISERFNIIVLKGEKVTELRIDGFDSLIKTDAQVSSSQDNNSTVFAGTMEIDNALIEAEGFQQNREGTTLNAVNSTHSYRFFRINLETLEISPILQQSMNIVMTHKTSIDPAAFNMDYMPAVAGIYLKKKINKKQSFKFMATGGTGFNLRLNENKHLVPASLSTISLKLSFDL